MDGLNDDRDRAWKALREKLRQKAEAEAGLQHAANVWTYQDDLAFNVSYQAWLRGLPRA